MLIAAVLNQKGGVGKSTLACHLAVFLYEQELRVCLLDADGQQSSSRWVAAAEPGVTVVVKREPDDILEYVDLAKQQGLFDVIVADGPGNALEGTRSLMLVADIALVPCGPSVLDLESTGDTVRVLSNAQRLRGPGKPKGLLIPNRIPPKRRRVTREASEAAQNLGLPVCSETIGSRDSFIHARSNNTVVWRMGWEGADAAMDLMNVFAEVLDHAKTNIHAPEHHG